MSSIRRVEVVEVVLQTAQPVQESLWTYNAPLSLSLSPWVTTIVLCLFGWPPCAPAPIVM